MTEEPSIADISSACEMEQLTVLAEEEELLAPYENIRDWQSRMRALPHWDETHAMLYKVREKAQSERQRS